MVPQPVPQQRTSSQMADYVLSQGRAGPAPGADIAFDLESKQLCLDSCEEVGFELCATDYEGWVGLVLARISFLGMDKSFDTLNAAVWAFFDNQRSLGCC